MANEGVFATSQSSQSYSRFPAIAMILLGIAALFLPAIAGIGISVLFGAAVFLAGIAYGALAFAARGTGVFLWRLLVSIVFTLTGLDLLAHPGMGLATLTVLVAITFLLEGVAEIASFFAIRDIRGSGLLLLNVAFSLILAFLIWRNWPYSSSWAIGTLIGVNLITTGFTRLRFAPQTT